MKNKLLTSLFGVCIVVLIITFSIGLPIYVRPFYYAQVDLYIEEDYNSSLDSWNNWAKNYYKDTEYEEFEELSADEIKDAFNEVMDFLTIPGNEFGTGKLPYRDWTKDHFVDCKFLFDLNIICFIISFIGAAVLIILNRCKVFDFWYPFGMNISFYSGSFTLGGFGVIGGLVALDFDRAFTVFHVIFFPGKDNWVFDPVFDRIVMILPQNFFMNCAILIFSSIILLCIGCICSGLVDKFKARIKKA